MMSSRGFKGQWWTLALLVSSNSFAGVPSEWVSGQETLSGKNTRDLMQSLSRVRSGESRESNLEARSKDARALDPYLESGSQWIEMKAADAPSSKTPASQKKRPWYLQSIKAELGVEASGEIGFLGAEGEAAVELIWTRTPASVRALQKKHYGVKQAPLPQSSLRWESTDAEEAPADLELSSESSERQTFAEIQALATQVEAQSKIQDKGRFRKELMVRVAEARQMIETLAQVPSDWNWKPYKYQLQLFVQAEGRVTPIVEAGAVARVRIEWNIVQKDAQGRGAGGGPGFKLAGLSSLVNSLDQFTLLQKDQERLYELQALKIGVGVGGELELGLAEMKASALGSVFLRREASGQQPPRVLAPTPVSRVSDPSIPYEKLQAGLARTLRIVDAITTRAELHERKKEKSQKERDFQLFAIEVELEASTENGFVLASVSKAAAMEIFFVRRQP